MEHSSAATWFALCRTLGVGASSREVLERLVERYGEACRSYHTLEHVIHCLKWFTTVRNLASHPDEVAAALWLHDVIYDPRATDNEVRSAEWAAESLREAGVAPDRTRRVVALILATRHATPPADADAARVVDIDLAILGEEPATFDEYERGIRQEYGWVPEAIFRTKRAELLERFLERPAIYHTPFFRERLEAQARLNLARSICALRRGE